MTSDQASRPPSVPARTLADVLAAVLAADLPARRRREMASAVRTIGRIFERPLEEIPAHPSVLGPRLRQAAPIASGISRLRWNNIRSLASASLALVQPMSPGRHVCELSAGWQQRSDQLKHRGLRIGLSRFMRFCSALGTEPEAVTARTVESYREHLGQTLKRPQEIFSMTAKAWHRAQGNVPDWPSTVFHVQGRQNRWALPMSALPESFGKDCEVWLDRLSGRDLLDEMQFRPVRPSTVELRRRQLRLFASAVILRGRNPDTIASLRDLVEIDTVKDGLRYLLSRSDGKPTSTIFDIASALKAVAQHHVRVDTAHLSSLRSIVNRLNPGRAGLTDKNTARLRPFDDRENAAALLNLPAKLMTLAARARHPRDGALQAQIATAIEVLTFVPIRLHNLANLDIERNLVLSGAGRALHVVIPAEEVKNREPIEHPLPEMSVKLIKRYIRDFRPCLTTKENTALFPGKFGGAKRQHVLRTQISRTVYAHTGLEVNPHLFRHIDAKLYLDRNPGSYEVVRRVLGHRSMTTTVRFYAGRETAAAARHFDQEILDIRGEVAGEKVIRRRTNKK
jgi:integrase